MANTYTQLYIQLVFSVKNRQSLIHNKIHNKVERYITGIIQNNGHKLLAIFCMPDHCHIFVGLNPVQSISDLTRVIKSNSSKWINEQRFTPHKFSWQEGYGAFSYAKSQKDVVIKYILNQPKHHKKKTFREEYFEFLRKFEIEFDEKYLFEWLD